MIGGVFEYFICFFFLFSCLLIALGGLGVDTVVLFMLVVMD